MEQTEILVADGNLYTYTTSLIKIENALGIVKAILREYDIYRITETTVPVGKLYRTNERNWYDMPGNIPINPLLSTLIKKSIDKYEKDMFVTHKEGL